MQKETSVPVTDESKKENQFQEGTKYDDYRNYKGEIDHATMNVFFDMTQLPFPRLSEHFWYYLVLGKTHYNTHALWQLYVDALQKCNGISKFQQVARQTQAKIQQDLNDLYERYILHLLKTEAKEECKMNIKFSKGDIYNKEYTGKFFLSLDITEAQFQSLGQMVRKTQVEPNFPSTWTTYLQKWDNPPEFLAKCKPFRQLTLGKTKWIKNYIPELHRYFILPMLEECKQAGFPDPILVKNDEILFEFEFSSSFNSLNNNLPLLTHQHWNVETFQLVCLSEKRNYYVKINQETKERRLKAIVKEHVCQVIKKDLQQEVDSRDLIIEISVGKRKEYAKLLSPSHLE